MKQIRRCIFETNSSSTHAIVLSIKSKFDIPQLPKVINISNDYFGWEKDCYNYWKIKLSYLIGAIYDSVSQPEQDNYIRQLKSCLKNLGVKRLNISKKDSLRPIIDHGYLLVDFVRFVFSDVTNMRLIQYLFCPDTLIFTGNDNDSINKLDLDEIQKQNGIVFYKGN